MNYLLQLIKKEIKSKNVKETYQLFHEFPQDIAPSVLYCIPVDIVLKS